MDFKDQKNYIFNIRLAKLIGSYQFLDPGTKMFLGRNIIHVIFTFILVWMFSCMIMFFVSCLYYWTENMSICLENLWKAVNTLLLFYKMWIIKHRSNEIWNCLSITWYGFTSFGFGMRHILDHWRKRSIRLSTFFAFTYVFGLAIFFGITQAFRNNTIQINNHDGSVSYYRENILNFYILVSDKTYNENYNMFCFVETLQVVIGVTISIVFDTLLVTFCFALCGQMQMIGSVFESVGHKSISDVHSPIDHIVDEKNKISIEHDLIYNELRKIIINYQEIIKKYEVFLAIFRKTMLLQVFVSSLSIILIWVIFIMILRGEDRFVASEVIIVKLLFIIPYFTLQIFLTCYLFGKLHDQKDSIIFSLYSSNWTEMDIKCKKLVLLTMKVNNVYYKKLRFTATKILNLELFYKMKIYKEPNARFNYQSYHGFEKIENKNKPIFFHYPIIIFHYELTMGNCYAVISVLINQIKNKE